MKNAQSGLKMGSAQSRSPDERKFQIYVRRQTLEHDARHSGLEIFCSGEQLASSAIHSRACE
jgi:hypothetical protein